MSVIDIKAAFETEPKPQDFIIPGFLAGTVGALIAPGSTGKSFWAMQLACLISSSKEDANTLGLTVGGHGKVCYLSLEDPASELERRLFRVGQNFSNETRDSIADSFELNSLMGMQFNIMRDELRKNLIKKTEGYRLIIIDTLSRAHLLDENNNGEMSSLLVALDSICRATGASILFLHHTSKASTLNGLGGLAQASRGASALIDNARWCGNLVKMTEEEANKLGISNKAEYVKFELGKINYGEDVGATWYKREKGGVLKPVTLDARISVRNNKKGVRREEI